MTVDREQIRRELYVYWCPRCEVQTDRSWHICRRGPALFPQMDEETTCERIAVVPKAELEQAERVRDEARSYSDADTQTCAEMATRALKAEAQLAKVPALVEALKVNIEASRGLTADMIAVKGHLDNPYPDDERWTPWTRFVERGLQRLSAARAKARETLAAWESLDAEGAPLRVPPESRRLDRAMLNPDEHTR